MIEPRYYCSVLVH